MVSPPQADREEHYRALMGMLPLAPINALYRPRNLVVRAGEASLEMPVLPQFFNGGRILHGSAYFKGLDEAAWFAAHSLAEDVAYATTSFTTYFLRSVSSGALQVRARVVSASRNLIVVQADMYNDGDKPVAHGVGTFQPTAVPLRALFPKAAGPEPE
jgi:uncharacterized protein (TIGR00369 family)